MILALDLSTNITGWAVFDGTNLINHGVIRAEKSDKPMKRMHTMREGIQEITKQYDITQAVIEEVYQSGGYKTFKSLCKLQGVIEYNLIVHDRVPVDFVYPTTWKSFNGVTGRQRAAQKASSKKIVKDKYNIDVVSDDESDVILLGNYYANKEKN